MTDPSMDQRMSLMIRRGIINSSFSGNRNYTLSYSVNVSDDIDNFAARLGFDAGLNYQLNRCVKFGFLYRLESWHNVSNIVNPDLTLLFADGDNRWTGNAPAHLVDDQAVTHAFLATIEWTR